MSLLSSFNKANFLPTAEETGVGEKATEEVNKWVVEVFLSEIMGQHAEQRKKCQGLHLAIRFRANTHKHTHKPSTVTLAAHARRGLITHMYTG